jgi:hypothetical protein
MTGSELARAMRWKNEQDVRVASMTWKERKDAVTGEERFRSIMSAVFFIGGFICGVGSFAEILMLLGFGILGPIAVRTELRKLLEMI